MGKQSILNSVRGVFLSIAPCRMQGGHYAEGEGDIPYVSFPSGTPNIGTSRPPSQSHGKDQCLPTEMVFQGTKVFSSPWGQWHTFPLTHRMGSSLGLNPLPNPRIKCMKTLSGATGFWGRKAGSSRSMRRVVDGDARHVVGLIPSPSAWGVKPRHVQTDRQTASGALWALPRAGRAWRIGPKARPRVCLGLAPFLRENHPRNHRDS